MQRPSTHSDWPKTAIRLDFGLDENTTSQILFCPCDLSILFRVDQPDLQGPAFQHPTPPIPGSCAIRKVWAAERMRRVGGGCFSYHLQFGQCICMATFQRDTSVRYHHRRLIVAYTSIRTDILMAKLRGLVGLTASMRLRYRSTDTFLR